jgi:hypothetical protein
MSEMPAAQPEKLTSKFIPFHEDITDQLSDAVDANPGMADLMLEDLNIFHGELSSACNEVWKYWNQTEKNMNSYIDGCSIAYTLFLMQGGEVALPEIDEDTIVDYFCMLEGEMAESYYDKGYEIIKNEDIGFALALTHYLLRVDQQMSEERQKVFVLGAVVAYDIIRHQLWTRDHLNSPA